MTAPTPRQQPRPGPPRNGLAEIEGAVRRAESARARFDQELDGLIHDLREARDAIKANPLPGEGGGDGEAGAS
jgi:hypothetical protein